MNDALQDGRWEWNTSQTVAAMCLLRGSFADIVPEVSMVPVISRFPVMTVPSELRRIALGRRFDVQLLLSSPAFPSNAMDSTRAPSLPHRETFSNCNATFCDTGTCAYARGEPQGKGGLRDSAKPT